MLADEARDAAPVPERPPCEEPRVRGALPLVMHDRSRDVPALPSGLRGAVAEVDVLAVEAEAGVEAAELLEHRAAQEHEAAEQPVRRDRSVGLVVEVVVLALRLERRAQATQRRAPDERAADGRKAPTRRDQLAVDAEHARAGDAAA